jgi:hypothetical protein
MPLGYRITLKNTRLDAITSAVSTSGLVRIYNGTRPATVDTALSGNTQLAELTCSATFAPAASSGTLTVNAIGSDASADASGTASFGSFLTSAGTRIVDFSVGTAGSDLNLNTNVISAGGAVSITSAVIVAGG